MRLDERLNFRAGLLQRERDSITRLLAVLEAARSQRDAVTGRDDMAVLDQRMDDVLADCDADPLLQATNAPIEDPK